MILQKIPMITLKKSKVKNNPTTNKKINYNPNPNNRKNCYNKTLLKIKKYHTKQTDLRIKIKIPKKRWFFLLNPKFHFLFKIKL